MLGKVENGLREAAKMLRHRLYRIVGHPDSGSTTSWPRGGDIDISIHPGDRSLAHARVTMSHSQARRLMLMAELGMAAFDAETQWKVKDCESHRELMSRCESGRLSGRCERGKIYLTVVLIDDEGGEREYHGEAADWELLCAGILAKLEYERRGDKDAR